MENLNCNNVLKYALFFILLFGAFSGCDQNEILRPVEEKETITDTEEPVDDNSNRNPVIHKLVADPSSVRMGEKLSLSVTANDPDGDEIFYTWESTSGEFKGSGVSVTWTAPLGAACCVPGPYLISVTIQDGKGGSDTVEIAVGVTL